MASPATNPHEAPTPSEAPKATVVAPVPKRKNRAMRAYLLLAGLAGAALAVYFIHGYLTRDEVATDDAQIDADVVPVAARVGGVITMQVHDNQKIDGKAPLAQIDPADYAAKVAAAQ